MLMLECLKPCSQKRMLCSLMNWIMHQSLMGYDYAKQQSIATDIWTCQVIIYAASLMMLLNISFCKTPCSVQCMFCKKSLQIVTPIGSGQSCPPLTAFCSCDWTNYFTPSYKINKIFLPHYFRTHLNQFSQPEDSSRFLQNIRIFNHHTVQGATSRPPSESTIYWHGYV
jgi:hypothetical protein